MVEHKKPQDLTEDEIISRLLEADQDPEEFPYPDFFDGEPARPAAVLIPLVRVDRSWRLLYTRRTDSLPEHSGQVAFPGGRADPEDATPEVTALRETREEIGVIPEDVRILGRLHPIRTITNYMVTPVVGVIPWPYSFRLATEEVSRVFTIPFTWLADPKNLEVHQRAMPPPHPPVSVFYFQKYNREVLWGVSAQITLDLLKALGLGSRET